MNAKHLAIATRTLCIITHTDHKCARLNLSILEVERIVRCAIVLGIMYHTGEYCFSHTLIALIGSYKHSRLVEKCSRVLSTSHVVYKTGEPIGSVVYCFYDFNVSEVCKVK